MFAFLQMISCSLAASLICAAASAPAEPNLAIFGSERWEYEVAEQSATAPAAPSTITVRVAGKEQVSGTELLKLETLSGGLLMKTELVAADERGLLCYRRTGRDGKTVSFDPPQTIVAAPLQIGTKWEREDEVAGVAMRQQFAIVAEEEVTVPAGAFQSYRLRCEQAGPINIVIERWYVPGLGFVKDITTMRGPAGELLSHVTTSLKSIAQGALPEEKNPPLPQPTVLLEVAGESEGEAKTTFRFDAPNIFVRWSGQNLPTGADARIAWIAEDVGDIVPPNFVVDVRETTISAHDFSARFTLARPKDGWATGKYRVALYLDGTLIESVKVVIHD